jgi:hypothetical protein
MVWGCFAYYGTGVLEAVAGTMNSDSYINIIDNALLPSADLWFPQGQWFFQQDNAPCHVSMKTRQHFDNHDIHCIEWPPNSCDMNPIENFWTHLKRRVYERPTANREDLITRIKHIWNSDAYLQTLCKTLVESMPRRLQACIRNHGAAVHSY